MKRFLYLVALTTGCGRQAENKPVQTMSPQPVMAAAAIPSVAAPEVPTIDRVKESLHQAINEIEEVYTQALDSGDSRKMQVCRFLLQRLREVLERLKKPDRDLAHELNEIRKIRSALKVPAAPAIPAPAPAPPVPIAPAEPIRRMPATAAPQKLPLPREKIA